MVDINIRVRSRGSKTQFNSRSVLSNLFRCITFTSSLPPFDHSCVYVVRSIPGAGRGYRFSGNPPTNAAHTGIPFLADPPPPTEYRSFDTSLRMYVPTRASHSPRSRYAVLLPCSRRPPHLHVQLATPDKRPKNPGKQLGSSSSQRVEHWEQPRAIV